jgi:hypothetical protein
MGWKVTVIATRPEPPGNPWPARLEAAGCQVILDPAAIGSLHDEVCIGFCCQGALAAWPGLRERGCRFIYSPCMNHTVYGDFNLFKICPPTALHFQSRFQADRLAKAYYDKLSSPRDRRFVIPGAFEIADFPYRPAEHNGRFVVGKLARPCRTKWPSDLWTIIGDLRRKGRINAEALCMAWNEDVEVRLGKPPSWARCLPAGAMSSQAFLDNCHALLALNGGDLENNPRVGMEAMASGVPIVADSRGGWSEMVENGVSGLLVDSSEEAVDRLRDLAGNELLRRQMIAAARKQVEALSDPSVIGHLWKAALDAI